jgi:hypothetical protein
MRASGCDLAMLGGQRQRYEYFGFTAAGMAHTYTATSTNVRHALSGVDVGDMEFGPLAAGDAEEIAAACARCTPGSPAGARARP